MRLLSEQNALERLATLKSDFKSEVADGFEHRAKSCLTCETQGACCLDAHFVNVNISRLEAVAITNTLSNLPLQKQCEVYDRVEQTIDQYKLSSDGDTFAKAYACPLFEKGTGCLVHNSGKPLPCVAHACYENAADLPPDELTEQQERLVYDLNRRTYGEQLWILPLPVALSKRRKD